MPSQKSYDADTYKAGADLSSSQYRVLRYYSTWDNYVRVLSDTGQMPVGVLQNKPSAVTGAACQIISRGCAKVKTLDKFSAGDWCVADEATGAVINLANGGTTGEYLCGIAMESADTADIMLMQIEIEELTTDVVK